MLTFSATGAAGDARAPWLYERLVGEAWCELDEPVRALHQSARGEGTFAVRRASRVAARLLASVLRMPAPGEEVHVRLFVTFRPDGERWHRTFDGRDFITEQRERAVVFSPSASGRSRSGSD